MAPDDLQFFLPLLKSLLALNWSPDMCFLDFNLEVVLCNSLRGHRTPLHFKTFTLTRSAWISCLCLDLWSFLRLSWSLAACSRCTSASMRSSNSSSASGVIDIRDTAMSSLDCIDWNGKGRL